ncbi:MAG: TIM barrel protein [Patescibacteria group bacterium]
MILGIKVGPDKQSFLDLAQTRAPFAEVWFNVNRADDYNELFAELKRRKMQVGLHFWGALPDGTYANIAYPDNAVLNQSLAIMKQTIDIAAQNGFQYVNIHPGSRAIVAVDLLKVQFRLKSKPVDLAVSAALCIENSLDLHRYAARKGVIFTVETVPNRITNDSRQNPVNIYELPISVIEELARTGIPIANDFEHTASNVIMDNPDDVWRHVKEKTMFLAPYTRLIHLGFTVPPYNGTDFHDHLDNPLLETNQAVPNKQQMIELLKLFKNRDDVWILVEPNGRHVENYFLAQKILEEALQN